MGSSAYAGSAAVYTGPSTNSISIGPSPRRTSRTVTTEREYDEDGKLVRETVVETVEETEPDWQRIQYVPYVVPYPEPAYPPYPQWTWTVT